MHFSRRIFGFCTLLLLVWGSVPTAHAGICGLSDDEAAVPGTGYAGYWRSTLGIVRLVHYGGNTLEGPATASMYIKGTESGSTFQGRFAEDTGEYHLGTITFTQSHEGRCLKGHLVYDNGEEGGDDWLGYRLAKRPEPHYNDIYELSDRTDHLKQLVGGILTWAQIDGPDILDIDTRPGQSLRDPSSGGNSAGNTRQPGRQQSGASASSVPVALSMHLDKSSYQPGEMILGSVDLGSQYTTGAIWGILMRADTPHQGYEGENTLFQANVPGHDRDMRPVLFNNLQPSQRHYDWRYSAPDLAGAYEYRLFWTPAPLIANGSVNHYTEIAAAPMTVVGAVLSTPPGSSGGSPTAGSGGGQWLIMDSYGPISGILNGSTLQVNPGTLTTRYAPPAIFRASLQKNDSGQALSSSLYGQYITPNFIKGEISMSGGTALGCNDWGTFELNWHPEQNLVTGQFNFKNCTNGNMVFWGQKR